jgi:hypothetical protein
MTPTSAPGYSSPGLTDSSRPPPATVMRARAARCRPPPSILPPRPRECRECQPHRPAPCGEPQLYQGGAPVGGHQREADGPAEGLDTFIEADGAGLRGAGGVRLPEEPVGVSLGLPGGERVGVGVSELRVGKDWRWGSGHGTGRVEWVCRRSR